MRAERDEDLSENLHALLGDAGFLALVEACGGERVYVPAQGDASRLVERLGPEIAAKLGRFYGGDRVNVPLARSFRARQYRAAGMTDLQIARRLVITLSALERLFRRMPDAPPKRRRVDPRQMTLFE